MELGQQRQVGVPAGQGGGQGVRLALLAGLPVEQADGGELGGLPHRPEHRLRLRGDGGVRPAGRPRVEPGGGQAVLEPAAGEPLGHRDRLRRLLGVLTQDAEVSPPPVPDGLLGAVRPGDDLPADAELPRVPPRPADPKVAVGGEPGGGGLAERGVRHPQPELLPGRQHHRLPSQLAGQGVGETGVGNSVWEEVHDVGQPFRGGGQHPGELGRGRVGVGLRARSGGRRWCHLRGDDRIGWLLAGATGGQDQNRRGGEEGKCVRRPGRHGQLRFGSCDGRGS